MGITNNLVLASFIANSTKAGAEIIITPHDWLNPDCGYTAILKVPASNKQGYVEIKGSSDTANGVDALHDLINRLSST